MLVLCPRMTLVWKISWKPNTCARSGAQRVGLAPGAGWWRAAEPAGGVRCEPRTPAVPRPSLPRLECGHGRFLGGAAVPSSWAS